MADNERRAGRASLTARALDADEQTQLQVLKAATEASAPLYAAILAVLVAAKERYQVQVRTEEVARDLAAAGHDTGTLTSSLEQLKDWGAVTWTQDTSRVARLEDFHRRRELWQLTAAGHAAHDSILRVLGAAEQAGSLQRTLFRDIRENLDALAARSTAVTRQRHTCACATSTAPSATSPPTPATSTPPWPSCGGSTSSRPSASWPTSTC